jgi:hypothetical protein
LGAIKAALRRTLLAESLLLCGAGAILGVVCAYPMVNILARYASRFSVRALDLSVDPSMLWVGAGLMVRSLFVLFFALPLLGAAAWGQLVPSPDAPPVSTAPPPPPEEESMGTLKLNVNLVDLFFTVKNKSGELVPHLTKDDCSVAED